MGVVKNNYPAGGGNFKHGTGFFKIKIPCVVQWSLLWFSAPTNLNRILGSDLKIKKKVSRSRHWCYHERYCETIQWRAHTEVVYVDFGGQGPTTYTQEVGSKQGDERMEGEREFHTLFF